jgi:glucosyl-dolichyl phosphate glucuronosyltransferase
MMFVTVAICTWNRAPLLDKTLTQFRALKIPAGVEWELVVVNNNSTDETDAVIEKHCRFLPIRRLFQPEPGKSHAANLAVASARGELILWTDDDVLVDPDWLAEYVQAAHQHPQATFFGGTITPWFEVNPPRWIARHFVTLRYCFAAIDLGPALLDLGPKGIQELPIGANMAMRTTVLRENPFSTDLGPRENEPRNNEEIQLFNRLRSVGHQGLWVGTARVQHYIPAAKLTGQFIYTWFRWHFRVQFRSWDMEQHPSLLWGTPRWLLRHYWVARCKAFLLSPLKSSAWLGAFIDSARWHGAIEHYRFDRPACQTQQS